MKFSDRIKITRSVIIAVMILFVFVLVSPFHKTTPISTTPIEVDSISVNSTKNNNRMELLYSQKMSNTHTINIYRDTVNNVLCYASMSYTATGVGVGFSCI